MGDRQARCIYEREPRWYMERTYVWERHEDELQKGEPQRDGADVALPELRRREQGLLEACDAHHPRPPQLLHVQLFTVVDGGSGGSGGEGSGGRIHHGMREETHGAEYHVQGSERRRERILQKQMGVGRRLWRTKR